MRTVPREHMTCRHVGVPASSGGHTHLVSQIDIQDISWSRTGA